MAEKDFDDILTALGTSKWNYFHYFVYFLGSLMMPSALLGGPFVTPSVTHKCNLDNLGEVTILDECHYMDSQNETKACLSWDYESDYFPNSMTEELNLVCERSYLRPTFQSSYMIGNFIGAPISGFLADRFGRHKMIIIGSVVMVSSGALYTFLSNIFLILFLRFLMGLVHSSARTTIYILCLEISEQKYRFATAVLLGCPWVIGMLLYGTTGYFIRDWRWLQRIAIIPAILYIILLRYCSESPRWLIVNGKFEEAIEVIKHAAKLNGSTIPPEEEIYIRMNAIQKSSLSEQRKGENSSNKKHNVIMNALNRIAVIFKTKTIRKLTILMYILFFSASLVYYGISLNATNFGLNPYLFTIVGGIIELPSSTVILPIINKFGVTVPGGISYIACGVVIIALVFVPYELTWLITILALAGRCLIAASFTLIYLMATEAYPTEVRMQGIGTSQLVGRIGAILAPYITDFVSATAHTSVPSIILGSTSIIAGGVTFLVPETLNEHLTETIASVEMKHSQSKECRNN